MIAQTLHLPVLLIRGMSALVETERLAAVEEAKLVASAFADLGGRILVTHAGGMVERESERPRQFEAGRSSIEDLSAHCARLELRLAVENSLPTHSRVGDTMGEVVRLVDAIDAPNIGICLDTSHANIGDDPVAALALVAHRLIAVHISDNDGQTDQHALPFEGTVNWTGFMRGLRRGEFDGVFMLEIRAPRPPPEMLRDARKCFDRLLSQATEVSGGIDNENP